MFHRMMNYGELEPRPSVLLTRDLIKKFLPKFRRYDDLIIIHEAAWDKFKRSLPISVVQNENSPFSIDEDELASLVCQTIQKPLCRRVAIDRGVKTDGYRSPNVSLILGDNGLVSLKDNNIIYQFDVTKCMFSFDSASEKMRYAELLCSNEVVVDLFAGIGYSALPLLVHAKAKHLYACEWNPDTVEALKKNLKLNDIHPDRYTVIEGDNRLNRPTNVAQRVILGVFPSCADWMKTALECVDMSTGAILHCHDLVEIKQTPPPAPSSSPSNKSITTPASSLTQNTNEIQKLTESSDASTSIGKGRSSFDDQSLLNQSLSSSSTSSHSTIEKLSAPSEDSRILLSSESDKETSSPVLFDQPAPHPHPNASINSSSSFEVTNMSGSTDRASMTSSNLEDSILEPPQLNEGDISAYESRGSALIARIKDELDLYDMSARLVHFQLVKSYSPYMTRVVFDIKVEPRRRSNLGERSGVQDMNNSN